MTRSARRRKTRAALRVLRSCASSTNPRLRRWLTASTRRRTKRLRFTTWVVAPSISPCSKSATVSLKSKPPTVTPILVVTTGITASWIGSSTNLRKSTEWTCASSPTRSSARSEEHTSELQSQSNLVCRLLLEKKKIILVCTKYTQFVQL